MSHKTRVFTDIDGTLNVWESVPNVQRLYEEGYFLNRPANPAVVEAIRILCNSDEYEVFSLSAYFPDSEYAIPDKDRWLDAHLSELDSEHRIYVPYGTPKYSVLPGGIRPTDILLDDYTINLIDWEQHAPAVKLLNGLNHTRKTWRGPKVSSDATPEMIVEAIYQAQSYWEQNKVINY